MRPEWGHPTPPEWGHPTPSKKKRLLVITGVALTVVLAAAAFALFVIYPRVGEEKIRDVVVPKLAKRLGHSISVDDIDVFLGKATLNGVSVTTADDGIRLATIETVVLRFDVDASFFGRIDLDSVLVKNASLMTTIEKDGSTPWDEMRAWLSRKRAEKSAAESESGSGGLLPKKARLVGASYELRDLKNGLTAVGEGLEASFEAGLMTAKTDSLVILTQVGPRAELTGVTAQFRPRAFSETAEVSIDDGSLSMWSGMRLSGIAGTISPASSGDALWIDLSGGWGGSEGRVWKAVGSFNPRTRQGELRIGAEKFELKRIASVLADSPLRDIEQTSVGAELLISSDGKQVKATGGVQVSNLSVFHPRLAEETIEDVSFNGEIEATYFFDRRELELARAILSSGGVEYNLSGMLRRGQENLLDELRGRLQIPRVDCQAVLDSIPTAVVPRLHGFELSGSFETDVEVHVRWDVLEETTLTGSVGIAGCKVERAAKGMSARKLRGQFRHKTIVGFDDGEPRYRSITVGPSSKSYVPFDNVSPHLVNSLLTTEDSSFFRHRGFIVSEFRTALIKNLEAGYFRYGASSITMQLVKNVYLDRQKTVSRKLQELFMTWYVETKIPKQRLMEVYVNAIEYGPSLYGIGRATERYFGKPASELNPTESAFISSILPAPRRRYRQYCRDAITSWTERKIERILELMLKRKRLTLEEYEQAMITPLLFRVDKSGCGRH